MDRSRRCTRVPGRRAQTIDLTDSISCNVVPAAAREVSPAVDTTTRLPLFPSIVLRDRDAATVTEEDEELVASSDPDALRAQSLGWDILREAATEAAAVSVDPSDVVPPACMSGGLGGLKAHHDARIGLLQQLEPLYPTQTALLQSAAAATRRYLDASREEADAASTARRVAEYAAAADAATRELRAQITAAAAARDDAVRTIADVRQWRAELERDLTAQRAPLTERALAAVGICDAEEDERERLTLSLGAVMNRNGELLVEISEADALHARKVDLAARVESLIRYRDALAALQPDARAAEEAAEVALAARAQRDVNAARVLRAKLRVASEDADAAQEALEVEQRALAAAEAESEHVTEAIAAATRRLERLEDERYRSWTPRPAVIDPPAVRGSYGATAATATTGGGGGGGRIRPPGASGSGGAGAVGSTTTPDASASRIRSSGGTSPRLSGCAAPMPSSAANAAGQGYFGASVSGFAQQHPGAGGNSVIAPTTTGAASAITASSGVWSTSDSGTPSPLHAHPHHQQHQRHSRLRSHQSLTGAALTRALLEANGITVPGMTTTHVVTAAAQRLAAVTKEARAAHDDAVGRLRLLRACFLPVRTVLDACAAGIALPAPFTAPEIGTTYLPRLLGPTTPLYLREPGLVRAEAGWNFFTTERVAFHFLIELAECAKHERARLEAVDARAREEEDAAVAPAAAPRSASAHPTPTRQSVGGRSRSRGINAGAASDPAATSPRRHGHHRQHHSLIISGEELASWTQAVTLRALQAVLAKRSALPATKGLPTSLSAASPSPPGTPLTADAVPAVKARALAYHLLHAANAYASHSPIVEAALRALGGALPLRFIDGLHQLLRRCVAAGRRASGAATTATARPARSSVTAAAGFNGSVGDGGSQLNDLSGLRAGGAFDGMVSAGWHSVSAISPTSRDPSPFPTTTSAAGASLSSAIDVERATFLATLCTAIGAPACVGPTRDGVGNAAATRRTGSSGSGYVKRKRPANFSTFGSAHAGASSPSPTRRRDDSPAALPPSPPAAPPQGPTTAAMELFSAADCVVLYAAAVSDAAVSDAHVDALMQSSGVAALRANAVVVPVGGSGAAGVGRRDAAAVDATRSPLAASTIDSPIRTRGGVSYFLEWATLLPNGSPYEPLSTAYPGPHAGLLARVAMRLLLQRHDTISRFVERQCVLCAQTISSASASASASAVDGHRFEDSGEGEAKTPAAKLVRLVREDTLIQALSAAVIDAATVTAFDATLVHPNVSRALARVNANVTASCGATGVGGGSAGRAGSVTGGVAVAAAAGSATSAAAGGARTLRISPTAFTQEILDSVPAYAVSEAGLLILGWDSGSKSGGSRSGAPSRPMAEKTAAPVPAALSHIDSGSRVRRVPPRVFLLEELLAHVAVAEIPIVAV